MTTFKGIRGTTIEVLSSDPSKPEEGQIWYNSSSGTLKGYQNLTVNAWSSGGNLNTTRGTAGTAGTKTAGLMFGGAPTNTGGTTTTEAYNGSTWTSVTGMNRANQNNCGVGLQTAALSISGQNPAGGANTYTELYNGSTWTNNPTGVGTARYGAGAAGLQTAALFFGGYSGGYQSATESFNGSTWTAVNSLNNSRYGVIGFGTQTAAIAAVGGTAPTAYTESWNGTSWTNLSASLNQTSPTRNNGGGFGTQTAGLLFGGGPPQTSATELWNGTSWTSNPTGLGTARYYSKGFGSQSSGVASGGWISTYVGINSTENWNTKLLSIKTITAS
jgi:hypothetical protein